MLQGSARDPVAALLLHGAITRFWIPGLKPDCVHFTNAALAAASSFNFA